MPIFLLVCATAAIVIILLTVVMCIKLVVDLMQTVQKSASETVVTTVSEAMAAIFGKQDDPVTQLPGNEETIPPEEPFYPSHELDDVGFPGSVAEIRGMEAGWAGDQTNPPNSVG